ncbi:MAG: hypothetical protein WDO56_11925 [Gammaproteobacteria bacterium]
MRSDRASSSWESEQPHPQPACIAEAPFEWADIEALAILDVHGDDRFAIRHGTHFNENLFVEMPGHEQPPAAVDELHLVLWVAANRPAQHGHELTVALKAFDFGLARLLGNRSLESIVQIPHAAAKRVHQNHGAHSTSLYFCVLPSADLPQPTRSLRPTVTSGCAKRVTSASRVRHANIYMRPRPSAQMHQASQLVDETTALTLVAKSVHWEFSV